MNYSPAATGNSGRHSTEGSWLGRLAGWSADHRRLVVIGWLVAIALFMVIGQAEHSNYEFGFSGNSQSQQVQNLLTAKFPQTAGTSAYVVFDTGGSARLADTQARIDTIDAALQPLAHVSGVIGPFDPSAHNQVSADGHIAFAIVQFNEDESKVPDSAVSAVVDKAKSFSSPGLTVAVGGNVVGNVVGPKPGPDTAFGTIAAMLVMLIAFGSLVAMGLPIITALFGIAIGFTLENLFSHVLSVPPFAPELLAMIGLGVGIDYALFIVTRYRQGLLEGRSPREAVTTSLATSGRAVLFAGSTVIISLCGLFIMNIPFMQGLAISAIAAVVLVMTSALTLLPAMLGYAGRAIDRLHVPGLLQSGAPSTERGFWFRWSRTIQRHPWTTGLSALLVLLVLAIPLFSMRLAFTDASNDPTSLTTRQAYDLLATGFGPGFNGPLLIATELPASGSTAVLDRLETALARTSDVAYVTPPQVNPAGDTALIVAYPASSPEGQKTSTLVTTLRNDVIPPAISGTGAKVLVGGETAQSVDVSRYFSSRLFWVIGFVILLAFILLTAVFRSLVIPLKAAIMNLLSVGAAYGVIVAVFQWGWGDSLLGAAKGPIDPWIPLMMFTILFGLSMDYEVFLLSRIREEWRRTGDNSLAVADGLARTARVITAAAAIMICVFGAFVFGDPLRVLKVFGLGLAASVLIDATLVRMILVPSVMELLGKANWWMPRWLDRVVPMLGTEVDVDEPVGLDIADEVRSGVLAGRP